MWDKKPFLFKNFNYKEKDIIFSMWDKKTF